MVDMGEQEAPWEAASRFGEMPLAEQIQRAGIVELVCPGCYAKAPGLEAGEA